MKERTKIYIQYVIISIFGIALSTYVYSEGDNMATVIIFTGLVFSFLIALFEIQQGGIVKIVDTKLETQAKSCREYGEKMQACLGGKVDELHDLGDFRPLYDQYTRNKENHKETEAVFEIFKTTMKRIDDNCLPIFSRMKFIEDIHEYVSQTLKENRCSETVYLSLFNYRVGAWPPAAWDSAHFKSLLNAKKSVSDGGATIISIFLYNRETEAIKKVVDAHKSVGHVFICENVNDGLAQKQCGMLLSARENKFKTMTAEQIKNSLDANDFDFEKSVLFLEEQIYAKNPIDGEKILNPTLIAEVFESYNKTLRSHCPDIPQVK